VNTGRSSRAPDPDGRHVDGSPVDEVSIVVPRGYARVPRSLLKARFMMFSPRVVAAELVFAIERSLRVVLGS